MNTAALRKVIVLVLAFALPFASLFHTVSGQGQSVEDFARDGDGVLKAAGYAFAIWGLLYAGCLAYGVYQAWPRASQAAPLAARLGWPAAIALASCISWVIAAELNFKWLTMAIIGVGAGALSLSLAALGRSAYRAEGRERWLVLWPLGGLAGWMTIASSVNLATVLAATDSFPPGLSQEMWALVILAAFSLFALAIAARSRLLSFGLTFGWGLVAVAVAEWQRHPMLAWAALVSLTLMAVTLWVGARRAPIFR